VTTGARTRTVVPVTGEAAFATAWANGRRAGRGSLWRRRADQSRSGDSTDAETAEAEAREVEGQEYADKAVGKGTQPAREDEHAGVGRGIWGEEMPPRG